jgi:hypothetical protein
MCGCRLVTAVVCLVVTTSGRGGYRLEFIMLQIVTLVPWGYEGLTLFLLIRVCFMVIGLVLVDGSCSTVIPNHIRVVRIYVCICRWR